MKQKLLIIKKQAIKRKNNWNFFLRNTCKLNKSNYLCTRNQEITDSQIRIDSVAQQVEHNTFNVGVLGSSPSWITEIQKSNLRKSLIIKHYQGFLFSGRQQETSVSSILLLFLKLEGLHPLYFLKNLLKWLSSVNPSSSAISFILI